MTADFWQAACNNGDTAAVSRQSFPLGEHQVPGTPQYFLRFQSGKVSGTSQTHYLAQRIEGCQHFANKKCTLSFWARLGGDVSAISSIRVIQNFGTGGSPSSQEILEVASDRPCMSQWQYHEIQITMPDITGKTLGSNENDYLSILWYVLLDSGGSFVFDIWKPKLEFGARATPFVEEEFSTVLAKAQRRYNKTYDYNVYAGDATSTNGALRSRARGSEASGAVSLTPNCDAVRSSTWRIWPIALYFGRNKSGRNSCLYRNIEMITRLEAGHLRLEKERLPCMYLFKPCLALHISSTLEVYRNVYLRQRLWC